MGCKRRSSTFRTRSEPSPCCARRTAVDLAGCSLLPTMIPASPPLQHAALHEKNQDLNDHSKSEEEREKAKRAEYLATLRNHTLQLYEQVQDYQKVIFSGTPELLGEFRVMLNTMDETLLGLLNGLQTCTTLEDMQELSKKQSFEHLFVMHESLIFRLGMHSCFQAPPGQA